MSKKPPSQRPERQRKPSNDATLDRSHMIQSNIERIEFVYVRAREVGVSDPVVFVIDPCDHIARIAAVKMMGEAAVQRDIEQIEKKGLRPTLTFAMERTEAIRAIAGFAPAASRQLQTPLPPVAFWVLCVAEGGTQVGMMKIPEI